MPLPESSMATIRLGVETAAGEPGSIGDISARSLHRSFPECRCPEAGSGASVFAHFRRRMAAAFPASRLRSDVGWVLRDPPCTHRGQSWKDSGRYSTVRCQAAAAVTAQQRHRGHDSGARHRRQHRRCSAPSITSCCDRCHFRMRTVCCDCVTRSISATASCIAFNMRARSLMRCARAGSVRRRDWLCRHRHDPAWWRRAGAAERRPADRRATHGPSTCGRSWARLFGGRGARGASTAASRVISDSLWKSRFGGSPSALGATLHSTRAASR